MFFRKWISANPRTYGTHEIMTTYVGTYVTHENMMFFGKTWCYIWKCNMSELMLYRKTCNVQIYFTHEYEMWFVRTYVTYENVICPKVCYAFKYVLFPKLCYIWKCVMSEPMLDTEIWCRVSELMLQIKTCNVRTYVTRIWDVFCPN